MKVILFILLLSGVALAGEGEDHNLPPRRNPFEIKSIGRTVTLNPTYNQKRPEAPPEGSPDSTTSDLPAGPPPDFSSMFGGKGGGPSPF